MKQQCSHKTERSLALKLGLSPRLLLPVLLATTLHLLLLHLHNDQQGKDRWVQTIFGTLEHTTRYHQIHQIPQRKGIHHTGNVEEAEGGGGAEGRATAAIALNKPNELCEERR